MSTPFFFLLVLWLFGLSGYLYRAKLIGTDLLQVVIFISWLSTAIYYYFTPS